MVDAYRSILGAAPASFAAPAWLLTRDLFDLEQQAGLRFGSDTRGTSPFLPVFEGREGATPQYPVTLATLDECLGRMTAEEFVEQSLRDAAQQPDYACFTAHAESEGMAYKGVLESLLARLDRPVGPLGETATAELPRRDIKLGGSRAVPTTSASRPPEEKQPQSQEGGEVVTVGFFSLIPWRLLRGSVTLWPLFRAGLSRRGACRRVRGATLRSA
jgi:hypothetical protein